MDGRKDRMKQLPSWSSKWCARLASADSRSFWANSQDWSQKGDSVRSFWTCGYLHFYRRFLVIVDVVVVEFQFAFGVVGEVVVRESGRLGLVGHDARRLGRHVVELVLRGNRGWRRAVLALLVHLRRRRLRRLNSSWNVRSSRCSNPFAVLAGVAWLFSVDRCFWVCCRLRRLVCLCRYLGASPCVEGCVWVWLFRKVNSFCRLQFKSY